MRPSKPSPKRREVLNERAHAMRHAPTPSEAVLFRLLSGRKLGVGFKRQVPIGGYIADFVASSARLVVEVDGPVHLRRGGADATSLRVVVAFPRYAFCPTSVKRRSQHHPSFAWG